MHMAHYLQKNHQSPYGDSRSEEITNHQWSDYVTLGWYFVHFCQALRNGVVTFSFWKKDGSIREAKGTTHPLLIPEDMKPTSDSSLKGRANYSAISFFDLDKQDWRSFSITNFIGFVTRYEIKEKSSKRAVS